jgi:hypothetical protein
LLLCLQIKKFRQEQIEIAAPTLQSPKTCPGWGMIAATDFGQTHQFTLIT